MKAADDRSPYALIVPALERCLAEIADDRGCTPDDLSFRVFRALETFGLACLRLGEQQAARKRLAQSGAMPAVVESAPETERRRERR